jgi:hypothetical protein
MRLALAILTALILVLPIHGQTPPPAASPVKVAKPKITLAQRKADAMARRRVCCHVGGGFGRGRAEGVGTGRTRDSAIRHCCYWGRRKPIEIGAAWSGRRWYACVIYR